MEQLKLPLTMKVEVGVDGRVYFLHHTKSSGLQPGTVIRPSGSKEAVLASGDYGQTTAGDTVAGFSYGWDTVDPSSVNTAIYNQAHAGNVVLTSAPKEAVFLDINVPNSPARAIKRRCSNGNRVDKH